MVDFNFNLADFPASVSVSPGNPVAQSNNNVIAAAAAPAQVGFFRLSPTDPTLGFHFSRNQLPAHTYPPTETLDLYLSPEPDSAHLSQSSFEHESKARNNHHQQRSSTINRRLFLAAHLSDFLRKNAYAEFCHTASAGISTTKLMAKLVGLVNKPNKQTLLIPEATQQFLDGHEIGKIPGIGFRTVQILRDELLGAKRPGQEDGDVDMNQTGPEEPFWPVTHESITVRDARRNVSLDRLSAILNSKEQAKKLFGWLHGMDDSSVSQQSLIPTQISIEDTFCPGALRGARDVERVLVKLVTKLVLRMRKDLLAFDPGPAPAVSLSGLDSAIQGSNLPIAAASHKQKWLAHPRTFRLSVRPHNFRAPYASRISKSAPLPKYSFGLDDCNVSSSSTGMTHPEAIATKLVKEVAILLLRRMNLRAPGSGASGGGGWEETEFQLVNVAVVNIDMTRKGEGGDIEKMFGRLAAAGCGQGGMGRGGGGGEKEQGWSLEGVREGKPEEDFEAEVRKIESVYALLEKKKQRQIEEEPRTETGQHDAGLRQGEAVEEDFGEEVRRIEKVYELLEQQKKQEQKEDKPSTEQVYVEKEYFKSY